MLPHEAMLHVTSCISGESTARKVARYLWHVATYPATFRKVEDWFTLSATGNAIFPCEISSERERYMRNFVHNLSSTQHQFKLNLPCHCIFQCRVPGVEIWEHVCFLVCSWPKETLVVKKLMVIVNRQKRIMVCSFFKNSLDFFILMFEDFDSELKQHCLNFSTHEYEPITRSVRLP